MDRLPQECSAVSGVPKQIQQRQRVCVVAPVRTADVGGWTDTWFARRGMVTNVAVGPGVGVDVLAVDSRPDQARLIVDELGLDAIVSLVDPKSSADPFLAMAIAVAAPERSVEIVVRSDVPAACGLGTSAAISVAVIGGVWSLEGRTFSRAELAAAALAVETRLGLQSGVQDQLASAFGGTHRFDVRYPALGAAHRLIEDPTNVFGNRLVTVYLGQPHASSALHEEVIAELEAGDRPGHRAALDDLRVAAMNAAAALVAGDLKRFGGELTAHNNATRRLHPAIVSELADELGALAMDAGAVGWKANGAGGNGGTISLIAGAQEGAVTSLLECLSRHDVARVLDVAPVREGFRVTAAE